jgi:hypothetical protein
MNVMTERITQTRTTDQDFAGIDASQILIAQRIHNQRISINHDTKVATGHLIKSERGGRAHEHLTG